MKKNPPTTYSMSHKLLRATLAVAQVFSALSATLIGIAQPTLPEAIASLQPLIGLPQTAFAAGETITIVKRVVGGTSAASFPMTVTGPGGFTQNVNVTGGSQAGVSLTPFVTGTYTVTEGALPAAPAGFQWVGTVYEPSQIVSLGFGQTRTVTVTNMLGALAASSSVLTVTKRVVGAGSGPFNITVNGPSGVVSSTTIVANQTITFAVPSGVYTVTEVAPSGTIVTYTASSSGNPVSVTNSSSAVVTLTNAITTARFAATQITGRVYNDYNSDGNITANGIVTDTGVQSVTVTAYDITGAAVGVFTTTASGLYTFTPSAQGPYRVEFTNLPVGYEPSRVFTGTQNGTSVQFINSVAQASNVNFGVGKPSEYCQNNPLLCTSNYISGNPLLGGTANNPDALITVNWNGTVSATNIANGATVGATWGRAWQAETRKAYSAAVLRRHSGFGPMGIGGIYSTSIGGGASSTAPFVNLPTLGIDVGAIGNRFLPASTTALNTDTLAFAGVGKIGIGDIDIGEDGNTLWAVNLNNRSLVKMNVTGGVAPASAQEFALSNMGAPTYTGGVLRPWGLKFYGGKGYVGAVCSAETSGNRNDLRGYVLSFDPANPAGGVAIALTMPLTYTKGAHKSYNLANTATDGAENQWHPWTDVFSSTQFNAFLTVASGIRDITRGTPVLSDIEFDVSGAMILGFIDRAAMQMGSINNGPNDALIWYYHSAGDILRACPNALGVYQLENAGACGGATGGGVNGEEGPGGGEFYSGDALANNTHQEIAQGSLAYLPGAPEFATAAFDPLDVANTGGLIWLSNSTGARTRGFQTTSGYNTLNGYMGKAQTLGDMELLCDAAPIEIGNRAWDDLDGDGVQDAGEPGLAGQTVSLRGPGGVVSTTTTDANGNYYFRAEATTGAYSTTLRPYTLYTLSLSAPSGFTLTVPNAQALAGATVNSNHAISDVRDSDAYLSTAGLPKIFYQTGGPGQNNHGLDFGFVRPATGTVVITNTAPLFDLGNYVWFDTNNNGITDTGEVGISGVTVTLQTVTGTITTTTNASGYYSFTNLPAGTYTPSIAATNFVPGGVLASYLSSSGFTSTYTTTNNGRDHGIDPISLAAYATNGVSGSAVTLGSGLQPTGEDGGAPATPNGDALNNLTADFGFYRQQVGNTIWVDINDNGVLDSGELPYATGPITVTLVDNITGAVVSQTVTNNGIYTFTGVPSGTYVVSITVPGGFQGSTPTTNTAGIDNNDNGSPSGAFIVSAPFTATPGTNVNAIASSNANGTTVNPSIDFGLFAQVMSLGNYVWLDTNNDGLVNSGETGVGSVAVELYRDTNGDGVFSAGDAWVGSTSTNATGYYSFTNLAATTNPNSAYIVVITNTNFVGAGPLVGYRSSEGNGLSPPDPDNDQDSDDNGDPIGAYGAAGFVVASKPINLTTSGEPTSETSNPGWSVGTSDNNSNAAVDFGFYRQQVGNTIWLDANDNGLLDNGELPYTAGPITVALVDNATGAVVSTTTTSTGIYTFTSVPSGTFVVSITVPSGFRSSTPTNNGVGVDNNDNGSPSGAFIVSAPFTATPGSNINTVASSNATGTTVNPSIDFGLYAPVVNLGNRVWLDTDNDGLLDGTEVGRDGVRVELYGDTDGNGVYTPGVDTFVRFSNTVSGGYYTFTALPEGNYVVVITSTNFGAGGALVGYSNSTSTEANINANNDETAGGDNGTPTGVLGGAGYVSSAAINLTVGNEPSTSTAAGDSNWTVDFGFYKLEVGNQVWYDTNNDGLLGGSEVGVGNVPVALLDGAGNVVSTTSTNASGFYTFTNLASGSYRVVITAPVSYRSSDTNSSSTLNADNDDDGISQLPIASGTVITSALFSLTAGSNGTSVATDSDGTTRNPAVDFGIYKLEVGNQVWYDDNNNGVRDSGEIFAPNIAVAILNSAGQVVSTTTTDPTGYYTFTGLVSGTYVISVTPPVGALSSDGQVITDGLNLNDHGAPSGAFIVSQPFAVTPGGGTDTNETATNATGTTVNYNLDFGLWRPVSLGNTVWFDTNNNGLTDTGEQPVGSVAMALYYDTNNDGAYSPGDVFVSSTQTSNTGYYSFTNLRPTNGVGSAYLVVISPTNFVGAGPLANYRSSSGNNVSGSAPDPDGNVDNDDNGDEIGSVYTAGFLVSSKAITLTPNTEPTGEVGGNGANDPTADVNSNLTVDFGFYKLEVGNQIWIDTNDDGLLNNGEVLTSGIAVALMDNAGNVVSTTTTNAQGFYTFTALVGGTYVISVTPPAGYRSSTGQTAIDGLNETDHGKPSGAFIVSDPFDLTSGGGVGTNEAANNATGTTQNPNLDFGLYLPRVSLGNYVWFDTDNDGITDTNEVGVGSVAVELYQDTNGDGVFNVGDVRISTTQTSNTGYYSFTNLTPTTGAGTGYIVVIANTNFVGAGVLSGYRNSDGNGASAPDPDNDADSDDNGDESGLYGAANFIVASKAISVTDRGEPTGELGGNGANDPTRDADSNLTVDFGFYRLQLGNLVWEDLNNDGDFDAGEPTLNGVAVTLYASDGNTVISTTTTNASGNYTFTGLLSGTYIVAMTPPAGYKSSTGAGNAYEPGASTFTGATDSTDHGTNAGAEIRSSAIVLRPGDAATNGNGNAITPNTGNTANPTVDFGIWRPASLGDYVWVDTDRDGVQDGGEIGVDGVTVTLLSSTGTVISVTRTGPNGATNGYYTFTNLIGGTYVVSFTLPEGYAWTTANAGAATDATDSDAVPQVNPNSLFAVTGPYVLTAGESNPTVDAGMILPTVYLGNRVWFDTNNDGLDNDGTGAASGSSTGTDGVTLDLYKDTNGDGIYTPGVDQFVSTTVSAGGGFYNFTNLLQGAYVVVITGTNFVGGALNGYQSSSDIGSTTNPDGNLDRDDNGVTTGALGANGAYVSSRAITLTFAGEPSGQNEAYDANGNGSLDFGFYKLSMGDTVFEDYNNNGVQDAADANGIGGEPGIPNVPVALYDSTGTTVLQSTTTDANGVYTFTGLMDDVGYVVGITLTAAYTSSTDIATSGTPGNNVNRDDNGTNVNGLVVKSNVMTPNAGAVGATNANTVTAATGSTNDPTVDFGIWRPASLGNYVWEDIDNDGQQDEPSSFGVNGVQVTLFVFSPTLNAYAVAGTTTTANDPIGNPGYYTFTNLISATYVVAFTAPSGYTLTKQDTGGEPGDSDAALNGQTAPVVLNAGDVNPTVDAGLFRPLSLGNRVFIDNENNGLDDGPAGGGANGSSVGVDGVTVNLYRDTNGNGVLDGADTAVSNTLTANGGYYTFTNLFSGTYLVQIPPSNFAGGGPLFNRANSTGNGTATTDGNTNFDDDGREQGSADNIVSGPITLTASLEPLSDGGAANDPIADGNSNYTVDFGFYPQASIGDRVWHDYNANGIQDTEEITGVGGVEVVLYDAITGSPVTTTTTGSSGDYTFTKLPPGSYFVQFNLPPVGWATSPADQAGVANDVGDSPNDSDGTPVPGFPNVLRTTTVVLSAGENDPRWDQGVYFTASLGDRMWEDLDRNGVQDAGEPGVVSATVTLYANGVPISTTQTITNGFYEFSDLTPGVVYSVAFSLPQGYSYTIPNANGNLSDTADSDVDVVTGGTQTVTLVSGQRYPDLDAGIWRPAGIGDRVWLDNDRDGLQTITDTGVPNVVVNLWQNGAVLSTTQTNPQGYYSFTGLIPGAYSLTFGLPAGYARTQQDVLGNTQEITDSDALTTTGATTTTVLTSGEYDPTWDEGIYQLASLGDYVWEDINHDGIQNENTPIQGVTVVLYDANDTPVLTTTTSITGFYQFVNLEPGNYSVGFTAPSSYTFTQQNNGNPDTSNSDSDVPVTGRTIQVNLAPGENDPNLDAGLWRPAKLGDYVWEDLDADGQQDANEPGVNGVAVALIDSATGAVVSTTTTYNFLGVNGYYTFTDLISGTYAVSFTAPVGYYFTGPNVLADATDSDAVVSGLASAVGATGSYPIFPGDNNPTVDAGIVRPASLGDRVWLDLDRDGRQTNTDTGVPTVTVQLLNAAGSVISTTTTDANGYYTFSNLSPGDYAVQFTIPSGYTYTRQDNGLGDADDSDANPITGKTISTTLISGENDPTWDAGIFPLAGIGDRVWYDVNANGIQDASEIAGVPGITVTLYDISGTVVATMQTDADGLYSFTNLLPGDYAVGFELPAGWGRSPQDREQNGDDEDSDAAHQMGNIVTGRTTTTTLNPGEYDPTWDSGIFELASLGNYVWEDLNHDGRQDFGEPPISGVTVTLYAADGTTALLTTTTSITGFYQFVGLTPTTFIVGFTTPPQPPGGGAGYLPTVRGTDLISPNDSNPNPADGKTAPVSLAPGENNPTIDAGYWRPASLGDYVWEDYDNDGQQELGEPGINGVLVTLLDDGGNVISTTLTANYLGTDGYYTFTELISDTYVVSFTNPAGYRVTKADTGGEPTDSDGVNNGVASVTGPYVLNAGESIPTVDQGYWRPASLGNYVWYDDNVNGLNDEPANKGVNGVTVRLYGSDGTTLISTTVTAADPNGNPGYYTFTDLISGSYQVAFDLTTLPAGYQLTQEGPTAGKDFIDSDPISTTGRTQTITLVAGEVDPTWDMGIWKPSGLGDFVWEDYDHDGQQDAGEPGVNGVTVNLLDDVGNVISTTTTGPNGYYSFTQLKPGTYAVAFVKPSSGGYEFTLPTQGITTTDSNADTTTGQTAQVALGPGEFNPTIDAGLWRPASLGDYLWEDINHDGIQNDGATGVNGVLVTLLDDEGHVVGTTTTFTGGPNNAAGYYTFTQLISDTYVVSFTLPVGYQWTTPNAFGNGNDTSDSDGVAQGNVAVTGPYVLNAGESIPTVDQGVWRPASVGNYVWMDDDRDGVNDEPASRGVNGVTVNLLDNEGFVISTTVTANDPNGNPGYYTFTNLAPERYYVEFDLTTLPNGYTVTVQGASGSKDATDSDVDPVTGQTEEITLVTDESDPTWDMGIWTPASLGNYVWEDYDHDGIQDLNEPPVQGVQVVLYGAANTPILTTTTSITGFYRFDGLTPSVPYYVGFTPPAGYEFTKQGTNPISALDSNADPVTGKTAPIILISGEYNPTLDAGLFRPASLGDYVWVDTNANGLQDESATGVNGVTVELLDAAGNVLSTTTTFTGGPNNAAGYYTFTNLISSTYQVRFTAPAGYSVTKPNSGNDVTDSDGVVSSPSSLVATTGLYVLNAGESNPTVDLGLYQPASLGDRVWYDYDADGIQDSGGPTAELTGVVGVQVVLYDAITNQPVATTTTGANGLYAFTNLVPGSYFVGFTLPTGYGRSPGDVSGAGKDATDSDANQQTGRTVPVTLVSGENDPTWDAGIYQLSSLGDRVWEDVNLNGTQDGGEPGVAGVVVTLYLNGVPISTTTTDASGFYGFFNLTPTVPYTLAFALPPGYTGFTKVDVGSDATDSDANPVTGTTGPITLLPGENNPNVDAGVVKPAGLGDYVWVDVNRDGQQQAGEPGVPDVVVTLYQNGVPVGTTTTNASGYYSFTNLTPGVPYSVSFGLPGGFAWTLPTVGITTTDSNADSNGGTTPITLVSGEYNPTIDAGVISSLKLSKVGMGGGISGAIGKDKQITYTLLITNTGAGAISNVTVDDPLPSGLTYAGRSTPPPASTNPLKWDLGTLNAGQTKTIVFVVTAIVNTGTLLTNTAYVNGPLGDGQILMAQDDANTSFAPDAVALMRFDAKHEKGGVKVIWQTSQEVNTFGFALYRSETSDRNAAVLATAELIPAQGRTGGMYAWLDVNVKANKRYTYWLIEAETTGAMNEYGPVQTDAVTNGTGVVIALQSNVVAEAGGVPVAGLPAAVAKPVKALGQRVLVETQPQTVNAVVVQQVVVQQTTTSDVGRPTSSAAPVSRAAVMEAIANPTQAEPLVVAQPGNTAPGASVLPLQAGAPSTDGTTTRDASGTGVTTQRAPAREVAEQVQPTKAQTEVRPTGISVGLLALMGLLMLVAVAGSAAFVMRRRQR